jgi:hypothetical protein
MKNLSWMFTVFFCVSLFAGEYAWSPYGKIQIDVPESWSVRSAPAGEIGYAFDLRPKNESNANCKITIAYLKQQPVTGIEDLKQRLITASAHFASGSVEGKIEPQTLTMKQGIGVFAQLTDKSLVGKPTVKREYKALRSIFVSPTPNAMAVITAFFDDPSQKEVEEMMSIVQSLQFAEAK